MKKIFFATLLLLSALASAGSTPASVGDKFSPLLKQKLSETSPAQQIRVIVFLEKDSEKSSFGNALYAFGVSEKHEFSAIPAYSVKATPVQLVGLAQQKGVRKVFYDKPNYPLLDVSTKAIGATQVWDTGYSGRGIKVAVIDSGIDSTHPAFNSSGKIAAGYDFADDDSDFSDTFACSSHGTHVAGIVSANGSLKGVAPNSTLIIGKVFPDIVCIAYDSTIMRAIEWSVAQGADIVTLSLGSFDYEDPPLGENPVEEMINQIASENDVVFSLAVGNSGPGTGIISSPAAAEHAISVGASDDKGTESVSDDTVYSSGNRGPSLDRLDPDILAPGVSINSSYPPFPYAEKTGTSMAAPHVAGAAALLLEAFPQASFREIRARLMETSVDIGAHVFEQGAGVMNVSRALEASFLAYYSDNYSALYTLERKNLSKIEISGFAGEEIRLELVLKNLGQTGLSFSFSATNLSTLDNNDQASNASFSFPQNASVAASSTSTVTINLSVPQSQPGIYGGYIRITSNDSKTVSLPVVLSIKLGRFFNQTLTGFVDTPHVPGSPPDYADMVFYELEVPYNASQINVSLSWGNTSDDLNLYLFDRFGNILEYSNASGGTSEFFSRNNASRGTHWVAVQSYGLTGSANYSLETVLYSAMRLSPKNLSVTLPPNARANYSLALENPYLTRSDVYAKTLQLGLGGAYSDVDYVLSSGLAYTYYLRNYHPSGRGIVDNDTYYVFANLSWGNISNNIRLDLYAWNDSNGNHTIDLGELSLLDFDAGYGTEEAVLSDIYSHQQKGFDDYVVQVVFDDIPDSSDTFTLSVFALDAIPSPGATPYPDVFSTILGGESAELVLELDSSFYPEGDYEVALWVLDNDSREIISSVLLGVDSDYSLLNFSFLNNSSQTNFSENLSLGSQVLRLGRYIGPYSMEQNQLHALSVNGSELNVSYANLSTTGPKALLQLNYSLLAPGSVSLTEYRFDKLYFFSNTFSSAGYGNASYEIYYDEDGLTLEGIPEDKLEALVCLDVDNGSCTDYRLLNASLDPENNTISFSTNLSVFWGGAAYYYSPPAPPVFSHPLNGSAYANSTVLFNWTVDAKAVNTTLLVSDDVGFSSTLVNISTNNTSFSPTPFSDGAYYWKARSCDEETNWGNWSQTFSFTVDTIEPVVNILSPVAGQNISGPYVFSFSVNGTGSSPSLTDAYYRYVNSSWTSNWTSVSQHETNCSILGYVLSCDANLSAKNLSLGNWTVELSSSDAAGNTGNDSVNFTSVEGIFVENVTVLKQPGNLGPGSVFRAVFLLTLKGSSSFRFRLGNLSSQQGSHEIDTERYLYLKLSVLGQSGKQWYRPKGFYDETQAALTPLDLDNSTANVEAEAFLEIRDWDGQSPGDYSVDYAFGLYP